MPISQTAFGQVVNGPIDIAGQGGFESRNQYLDAAGNEHSGISQQAPSRLSQTPLEPASNPVEQLNRVGEVNVGNEISAPAAGRDILDQPAPSPPGKQSSSQNDTTRQPDVSRAETSAGNNMNLTIEQYLAGVLDENPLCLEQDLPEQQYSPTGEREGVAHGEDLPAVADEVASSSGPGQEPNMFASVFGDGDALFDESVDFS